MMVNMFLAEEQSYNERKRKGSGCEADIYFSDGLTNEQSCEAGRESAIARVREYRVDIIMLKKRKQQKRKRS